MIEPQPSAAYLRALEDSRAHHRRSKTWSGTFLFRHAFEIRDLIRELGCKDVLDYGCGKGVQYFRRTDDGQTLEELWGVPVFRCDPAVPPDFKRPPTVPSSFTIAQELPPKRRWDLVLCTYALGSIPIEDLRRWVVPMLHDRANKAVFVAEFMRDALPKKDDLFTSTEALPRLWTKDQWRELLREPGPRVSVRASFAGQLETVQ